MCEELDGVRIDKWLWSVRLFKTRSIAQAACKKGRVSIDGKICKPAKLVKIDNKIIVKTGDLEKQILVKGLIYKRVSAKIATELYEII